MCFEAGIARMVRQGNVQEAASELGQRMTASSKASARQKNLLAICRAEMGDFIGARDILNETLSRAPQDLRTLNNLGNVALLESKPIEALELYRKASARNPWAVEPRYNSCMAYLQLGQAEKALWALQEYTLVARITLWGKVFFWGTLSALAIVLICARLAH